MHKLYPTSLSKDLCHMHSLHAWAINVKLAACSVGNLLFQKLIGNTENNIPLD